MQFGVIALPRQSNLNASHNMYPAQYDCSPGYPDGGSELVVRMDRAIRAYDELRTRTYASRPGNPDRIAFGRVGNAELMRFPAVGYFNQVYGFGVPELGLMPEIRDFFKGVPTGFKVLVAPDEGMMEARAGLVESGAKPGVSYARLWQTVRAYRERGSPSGRVVSRLGPGEETVFFEMYLRGFGAARAGWPAAIVNMTRLPGLAGIHCLLARLDGHLAGLGMLHVQSGVAHLCAGVVLPEFQGRGVQAALIDARMRIAREQGCDLAVSWTEAGNRSHGNLQACGFRTAYVDPVYHVAPTPDMP